MKTVQEAVPAASVSAAAPAQAQPSVSLLLGGKAKTMHSVCSLSLLGVLTRQGPCTLPVHYHRQVYSQGKDHALACSLSLLGVLARQGPCTVHVHYHYWVYSQGKDHALYMFIVIIRCTHKARTMHSTCSLSSSGVLTRQGPCTLHVHCHQVYSQGKDHALYMFIVIIRCTRKARTMHSTCSLSSSGVLARQGPCTLHVHCHHQVYSQGKDHALYMLIVIIRCTHKARTMHSTCSLSSSGVLTRQGPCTLHVDCHHQVYSQGKDHALYMLIVIIRCTHKARTMHSTCGSTSSQQPMPVRWRAPWPGSRSMWMRCATPPCVMKMMRCWLAWDLGPTFTARSVFKSLLPSCS